MNATIYLCTVVSNMASYVVDKFECGKSLLPKMKFILPSLCVPVPYHYYYTIWGFLSIHYFIFAWTHTNLLDKFIICGNFWVKFPQHDKKWKFVKAFIVKIISKITEIRWIRGRHRTSSMWLIINMVFVGFIFLGNTKWAKLKRPICNVITTLVILSVTWINIYHW